MSVQALTWVLEHSQSEVGARCVMFSLANHARSDGTHAWASVETLAHEARLSKRQTQRALRKLELELHEIEATGLSEFGTVIYRIRMGGDNLSGATDGSLEVSHLSPKPLVEPPNASGPNGESLVRVHSSSTVDENVTPLTTDLQVIREVYDYWRVKRGRTDVRYKTMSAQRRVKIQARLREFSVEQLKRAIDGVDCDPWEERPRNDDLTLIFRSREHVERFLEFADNPPLEALDERARYLRDRERREREATS